MTTAPRAPLRVGIVQMQSTEDVESNIEAALSAIERVAKKGCDLISLPENALFLRINRAADKPMQFDLKESFWQRFSELSKKYKTHVLVGSVPYKSAARDGSDGGTAKSSAEPSAKPTNSTIWIKPDGSLLATYDKIHLFDVDVVGAPPVRESDTFSHGRDPKIIEINGWRIGLSICYDLRFSELFRQYALAEVDLILVPAAFLVPTGEAHWHLLLRARAIEGQCYAIAAAQAGEHKSQTGHSRRTFGHSLAVAPWGEVLFELKENGPAEGVVELTPDRISKVRSQIPMKNHRRI